MIIDGREHGKPMATMPRQDSPTAPTDEEMRAEIPAIAKPYVMARDEAIATLERTLDEKHATLVRVADEKREAKRRFGGWLLIVDTIDDPAEAIATFMEWRGSGYDGDPLRFHPPPKASTATTCSKCGGLVGDPFCTVCDKCWCEACDCAACKGKAEPGPEAESRTCVPHGVLDCTECLSALSPVADGPIATRFDAMDLCKCGHIRRVHAHGVCLACASTRVTARKDNPVHAFAQSPGQFAEAFTAAREAEASDEPDVAGAFLSAPRTAAEHLHLAQLGARAHVVPHIRAAGEAAMIEGDPELFAVCTIIASFINGDLDPAILDYGPAFLRFVRGIGA